MIPTIAPYLLPALMTGVQAAYPELKVFVREEQTAPLLERLRQGKLDVAVIALPYDTHGLAVDIIGAEDVMVCMPAAHPLAHKRRISDDDLAAHPLLMLEDGHCLRDHALAACRLTARSTNEVYQATSLPTLVEMVKAGLGVTLLPRMAVPVEVHTGDSVVVRPLEGAEPAREIALVWRGAAVKSGEYAKLAGVMRAVFAGKKKTAGPMPSARIRPRSEGSR